jgi:hypothetical protein
VGSVATVGDYATLEEAALSGYSPAAKAFVVSVEMVDEWTARVIVDSVPSHPMTCTCGRDPEDGRWIEMWDSG